MSNLASSPTLLPWEKGVRLPSKIYFIRGKKVMLDRDLAELYGVETKRLNEQVRRNIKRFPYHFMFELTQEEADSLRSQIATLKRGEHLKYLPYAFTEHGILMLSNVLKSQRAIEMSIRIIDIFVKMRELMLTHKDIFVKLEEIERTLLDHRQKIDQNDRDIHLIFAYIKQLLSPKIPPQLPPRKEMGFKRKDQH